MGEKPPHPQLVTLSKREETKVSYTYLPSNINPYSIPGIGIGI